MLEEESLERLVRETITLLRRSMIEKLLSVVYVKGKETSKHNTIRTHFWTLRGLTGSSRKGFALTSAQEEKRESENLYESCYGSI